MTGDQFIKLAQLVVDAADALNGDHLSFQQRVAAVVAGTMKKLSTKITYWQRKTIERLAYEYLGIKNTKWEV